MLVSPQHREPRSGTQDTARSSLAGERERGEGDAHRTGPWSITIQLERQVALPSGSLRADGTFLFLLPILSTETCAPTLSQAKTPPTHAGAQLPAEEQARKLDYKPSWLAQKAFLVLRS